ncbi:MAG: cytochrome c biogenesis CcdA family protein [Candidatus Caenarcaniphilales bacterium]|nr:cytochrome c biogenesis CcdA family protein [Candidatus Caenarcaniphilales bacterium]
MLVLILFSFLSGVFTFLAPCIWPILPIVFSSSFHKKNKSVGIVLGVCISLFCLTLGASSIARVIILTDEQKSLIASLLIAILGLIMLIPALSDKVETFLSEVSHSLGIKPKDDSKSGFKRGVATGLALGFVWAPCAGPIIGAIVALSFAREYIWQAVLLTTFYVLGFGIPLLIFVFAGNALFEKFKHLNKLTERLQQVFGIFLIFTAILVYAKIDKQISSKFLDLVPSYSKIYSKIDQNSFVNKEIKSLERKDK